MSEESKPASSQFKSHHLFPSHSNPQYRWRIPQHYMNPESEHFDPAFVRQAATFTNATLAGYHATQKDLNDMKLFPLIRDHLTNNSDELHASAYVKAIHLAEVESSADLLNAESEQVAERLDELHRHRADNLPCFVEMLKQELKAWTEMTKRQDLDELNGYVDTAFTKWHLLEREHRPILDNVRHLYILELLKLDAVLAKARLAWKAVRITASDSKIHEIREHLRLWLAAFQRQMGQLSGNYPLPSWETDLAGMGRSSLEYRNLMRTMDYVLKQTPTIVVELNVCCHAAQYYHYTDSKLAKCMQDCHELLQKFKPESNNDHTTTAIYRMLANGSLSDVRSIVQRLEDCLKAAENISKFFSTASVEWRTVQDRGIHPDVGGLSWLNRSKKVVESLKKVCTLCVQVKVRAVGKVLTMHFRPSMTLNCGMGVLAYRLHGVFLCVETHYRISLLAELARRSAQNTSQSFQQLWYALPESEPHYSHKPLGMADSAPIKVEHLLSNHTSQKKHLLHLNLNPQSQAYNAAQARDILAMTPNDLRRIHIAQPTLLARLLDTESGHFPEAQAVVAGLPEQLKVEDLHMHRDYLRNFGLNKENNHYSERYAQQVTKFPSYALSKLHCRFPETLPALYADSSSQSNANIIRAIHMAPFEHQRKSEIVSPQQIAALHATRISNMPKIIDHLRRLLSEWQSRSGLKDTQKAEIDKAFDASVLAWRDLMDGRFGQGTAMTRIDHMQPLMDVDRLLKRYVSLPKTLASRVPTFLSNQQQLDDVSGVFLVSYFVERVRSRQIRRYVRDWIAAFQRQLGLRIMPYTGEYVSASAQLTKLREALETISHCMHIMQIYHLHDGEIGMALTGARSLHSRTAPSVQAGDGRLLKDEDFVRYLSMSGLVEDTIKTIENLIKTCAKVIAAFGKPRFIKIITAEIDQRADCPTGIRRARQQLTEVRDWLNMRFDTEPKVAASG